MRAENEKVNVLGVRIESTSLERCVRDLLTERKNGKKGYVCVTGAHGVMESQRSSTIMNIHNEALMSVPDGMPTVWMGHEYGFPEMSRVYGPDLMLSIIEKGGANYSHFLYGSTEETLFRLKQNLEKKFPEIKIAGVYAPPFRPLNEEEEADLKNTVNKCCPDFFWVGLSTPKQEQFMALHSIGSEHELDCGIMFGVGAAFDIHAGNYRDTPKWIQNAGLQWLHRLCKEPRRLWRRYLWIVPGFLWLAFLQIMGIKQFGQKREEGELE